MSPKRYFSATADFAVVVNGENIESFVGAGQSRYMVLVRSKARKLKLEAPRLAWVGMIATLESMIECRLLVH